jgi:dTDP-4-amino-4,6-dideoxygalactose transaminase
MSGWATSYDRHFQERFEAEFAAYVGGQHAVSVNSGGVALDLAVACLDAQPGDEVLSCALNFPGTHLAVLGARLQLVLCEPDPHTLNLDPAEIPRRMTQRTVAVLVTHMNGLPADMDAIGRATTTRAAELGIAAPRIIVDAARAVGAATPAGPVGSEGWLTVFSFHRKKLMTTLGEGGMLVTDCPETAVRLRRMRSFGQGETWGSSYRMTEFQAAVGSVQLRRLNAMNRRRITLARTRTARLTAVDGVHPPSEPEGFRHVYALYNVLLDADTPAGARDFLRRRLEERHRVGTVVANPPTYQANRLIRARTADQGTLAVAERVAGRLLCPGLHPLMTDQENEDVSDALAESVQALGGT